MPHCHKKEQTSAVISGYKKEACNMVCSVVVEPCWSTAASIACWMERKMQAIWWGQQRRGKKNDL